MLWASRCDMFLLVMNHTATHRKLALQENVAQKELVCVSGAWGERLLLRSISTIPFPKPLGLCQSSSELFEEIKPHEAPHLQAASLTLVSAPVLCHCDRQNNGLPKMSTSQSPTPVNMAPYMAKGLCRCDKVEILTDPGRCRWA